MFCKQLLDYQNLGAGSQNRESKIMIVTISVLYLYLAYSFTMNNLRNRKKVSAHMQMLDPNQDNIMRESFTLKRQMIK